MESEPPQRSFTSLLLDDSLIANYSTGLPTAGYVNNSPVVNYPTGLPTAGYVTPGHHDPFQFSFQPHGSWGAPLDVPSGILSTTGVSSSSRIRFSDSHALGDAIDLSRQDVTLASVNLRAEDFREGLRAPAAAVPSLYHGRPTDDSSGDTCTSPCLPAISLASSANAVPAVTISSPCPRRTSEGPSDALFSSASTLPDNNDSSWRIRNPELPVLPLYLGAPLTDAQKATRKISAEQRKVREAALSEAIQRLFEEQSQKIANTANQHGISMEKVAQLLTSVTAYKKTRNVSLSNALIFAKAQEVNGNRAHGSKHNLDELRQMVAEDPSMQNLSDETKENLKDGLRKHREQKGMSVRATNLAAAQDVRTTVDRMCREMDGLALRTGTYACLFVTRSHAYDVHDATWYGSENSMDFWEDVMRLSPDNIIKQFELWGCSQNKNRTQRDSLVVMKRDCQRLIDTSFAKVADHSGMRLNYANFNSAIKYKHGIDKIGWPEDVPFTSPSNINNAVHMRALRDALKARTCYFYKMMPQEHQAFIKSLEDRQNSGEIVKPPRKKRSDAGVPRKRRRTDKQCSSKRAGTPKSREYVATTDEDTDPGDGDKS